MLEAVVVVCGLLNVQLLPLPSTRPGWRESRKSKARLRGARPGVLYTPVTSSFRPRPTLCSQWTRDEAQNHESETPVSIQ